MFTPELPLKFPPAEQAIADRLLKIVPGIDRVEGYVQPHAVAVAHLAEILAREFDLRGHDLSALLLAALAHDLGERAMKRNYLLRSEPLTWEETLDLWRHPILGEQQSAEFNLPRQAQLIVRWHHESWNGEGYPDALAGESIPLGARILRVADTWCALTSDRPYRPAFDPVDAAEMIAEQAGIELDPNVVQVLLEHLAAEAESDEEPADEAGAEDSMPVEIEEEEGPTIEEIAQLPNEMDEMDEIIVPITEDPPEDPAPQPLAASPAVELDATNPSDNPAATEPPKVLP